MSWRGILRKAGIESTGRNGKISFTADVTMADTVTTIGMDFTSVTLTQDWDNAMIAIGSGDGASGTQHSFSATTHYIPLQINMKSILNPTAASHITAAMFRVNIATVDQANSLCNVLALRGDLAYNVYGASCINASMNISADIEVSTESVKCGYFSITGAGAITCTGDCNVLEAVYRQTVGGAGVDNVAQFHCNAASCAVTNLLHLRNVAGTVTNAIKIEGTVTTGIDFTDITYVPTGSNGPSLMRCGTYAAPLTHAVEAQSGLMRWYMETSADGTSYDRGLFVCLKTTGTKSVFPIAALAEVNAQTGAGPVSCMAGQFISHMNSATSKMPASGVAQGMFGLWAKVTANSGATTTLNQRCAPVWLDIQMNGANAANNISTTWGIFMSAGSRGQAFVGFNGTGGFNYLFEWDNTCYNIDPISSSTVDCTGNDSDGSIKILLNATTYYIPYFGAGKLN